MYSMAAYDYTTVVKILAHPSLQPGKILQTSLMSRGMRLCLRGQVCIQVSIQFISHSKRTKSSKELVRTVNKYNNNNVSGIRLWCI